jgi:hypothetical protein
MSETRFSNLEKHIDELLCELGSKGILDLELDEDDLGRLLAAAPPVLLSASFNQRVQAAVADAQSEREKRDPAIALGAAVGRARIQAGLGLAETAGQIGVSSRLLEALEAGQLSARQIMRNFPPAVATQLLASIRLAVDEFTIRLMDLAATGGKVPMAVSARTTDHRRQQDTAALVIEVADYTATLQRMAQSS